METIDEILKNLKNDPTHYSHGGEQEREQEWIVVSTRREL